MTAEAFHAEAAQWHGNMEEQIAVHQVDTVNITSRVAPSRFEAVFRIRPLAEAKLKRAVTNNSSHLFDFILPPSQWKNFLEMMGNPGPNYCVLMKQELGKNTFTVWLRWRSYRLPQPVKPHDLRIRKFEKVPDVLFSSTKIHKSGICQVGF
jgi:hypothetical protein